MKNHVAASPKSKMRGDEWAAFDRLPSPLRAALHEAVGDWCPLIVRRNLELAVLAGMTDARAVTELVSWTRYNDRLEVAAFSDLHRERYGTATPHVGAGVSMQRYGRRA